MICSKIEETVEYISEYAGIEFELLADELAEQEDLFMTIETIKDVLSVGAEQEVGYKFSAGTRSIFLKANDKEYGIVISRDQAKIALGLSNVFGLELLFPDRTLELLEEKFTFSVLRTPVYHQRRRSKYHTDIINLFEVGELKPYFEGANRRNINTMVNAVADYMEKPYIPGFVSYALSKIEEILTAYSRFCKMTDREFVAVYLDMCYFNILFEDNTYEKPIMYDTFELYSTSA